MNKILYPILLAAAFSGFVQAGDQYQIEGTVSETNVVAVSVSPALYAKTTGGQENALDSELRVCDGESQIPYAIRRQKIRKIVENKHWLGLKITKVSENGETLVVETEVPPVKSSAPLRFSALEVETPLKDFEQLVAIKAGDETMVTGCICDYSRFASFRQTEIDIDIGYTNKFTFVFSKPVTAIESAKFEQTIKENASGTVMSKEIRRSVEERPFRIDGLRLATTYSTPEFEPAPHRDIHLCAEISRDSKAKTTAIIFSTYFMPVESVGIRTKDENFSRPARVLVHRNNGWTPIAHGQFKVITLPGKNERSLQISFGHEVREQALKIELDDGDNPPISFEDLPVTCGIVPYDILFIAKPQHSYSITFEPGAKQPRYDQVFLEYISEVQDPVRLKLEINDDIDGGPTVRFLNPLPIIATLVFLLLLGICFWLIKSTSHGSK